MLSFLVISGATLLIVVFLVLVTTALGLCVGEDPVTWWKGFWS
jgi:hypothetical protein